jgi:hypothetical protein
VGGKSFEAHIGSFSLVEWNTSALCLTTEYIVTFLPSLSAAVTKVQKPRNEGVRVRA